MDIKKQLTDNDGNRVFPNTLAENCYMPDGTPLTATMPQMVHFYDILRQFASSTETTITEYNVDEDGIYSITCFIQTVDTAISNSRNYVAANVDGEYTGILPVADISYGPRWYTNTASSVVRIKAGSKITFKFLGANVCRCSVSVVKIGGEYEVAPKPDVRTELEFSQANELICQLNSTQYTKTNAGLCFGGYAHGNTIGGFQGNYTGPILVGETAEAVYYTGNTSATPFEYNGKTYYKAGVSGWTRYNVTSSGGNGVKLSDIPEYVAEVKGGTDPYVAVVKYYLKEI